MRNEKNVAVPICDIPSIWLLYNDIQVQYPIYSRVIDVVFYFIIITFFFTSTHDQRVINRYLIYLR